MRDEGIVSPGSAQTRASPDRSSGSLAVSREGALEPVR
jgi:hypothetical protein